MLNPSEETDVKNKVDVKDDPDLEEEADIKPEPEIKHQPRDGSESRIKGEPDSDEDKLPSSPHRPTPQVETSVPAKREFEGAEKEEVPEKKIKQELEEK